MKTRTLDYQAQNVFGFLAAKGLLFVDGIDKKPSVKLDIAEVLRVGTEIEPRVLEVLPAALLHFPRTFLNWGALPTKVYDILEAIKRNLREGPDLGGIPFKDLKRWANLELKDKRVVPANKRRVMKSLRFSPEALKALKKKAEAAKMSETDFIESLILNAS